MAQHQSVKARGQLEQTQKNRARPLSTTVGSVGLRVWAVAATAPNGAEGKFYPYEIAPPPAEMHRVFEQPPDNRIRGLRRGSSATAVLRALAAEVEEAGAARRQTWASSAAGSYLRQRNRA